MYPNSGFNQYYGMLNTTGGGYNGYPTGVLKVSGFEGAKAYQMGTNQIAALFDANDNVFWLKSTDSAGFATYRTFRYTEDVPVSTNESSTGVSREEFEELKAVVNKLVNGGE